MKRITTLVIAAMAAFTIGATTIAAPAHAGKRERRVAVGVLLGAIGGAIVADQVNRSHKKRYNRRYDEPVFVERRTYVRPRKSRWQRHVNRCYRNYRSYDERSDTFIGYDGIERRCRL